MCNENEWIVMRKYYSVFNQYAIVRTYLFYLPTTILTNFARTICDRRRSDTPVETTCQPIWWDTLSMQNWLLPRHRTANRFNCSTRKKSSMTDSFSSKLCSSSGLVLEVDCDLEIEVFLDSFSVSCKDAEN